MKRSSFAAVSVAAFSMIMAFAVVAQAAETAAVVTKEVTGEAAIVEGNKARAEKEATDRALRNAVEQVAGLMLSAETLTANSQLISDKIYANTAGYVRKYEVVSKKEEAGVMKVTVKADIGAAQIDKDLQAVQAMIRRLSGRKLVILLQEHTIQPSGVMTSSGVLATVLTDAFKADGWTIIDPHFAAGKLKLAAGATMGTAEAKEIGELSKADYILYGNANFRNQPTDGGMFGAGTRGQSIFPVTGEYELTVFSTDAGSQLSKVAGKFASSPKELGPKGTVFLSYERTAFDIAKNKGKDIVAEVRAPVMEHLRDAEQNGNRVVMNVLGLPEYASVMAFRKVLSDSITGVRDVTRGKFVSGKAEFEVTFVGTTDDLAEVLGGKTFKGKKINVTGVTSNTVELQLAK